MESVANLGRAADDRQALAALGRRARRLRERLGIGIDALADRAEIESRELRALEAGMLDPSYDVLIAVAGALDVAVSTLADVATDIDD